MRSPRIGNRSITSAVAAATSFLSFRHKPASAKLSLTDSSVITDFPSETCMMPLRANRSGLVFKIDLPFQLALPFLTSFKPDKARSNVVLPAPFEPMTAVNFPLGTRNERLLIARIAP
ncbi:unannotated protein [freshwater metagenome]|uniref:Unannotated protein n=1 Tax=freshwater metagenome TaxID=449393 RepID=A0A6J6NUB0_9ZZZZ